MQRVVSLRAITETFLDLTKFLRLVLTSNHFSGMLSVSGSYCRPVYNVVIRFDLIVIIFLNDKIDFDLFE